MEFGQINWTPSVVRVHEYLVHHTIQEADDRQMPDQDKPFVSLVKGIPLSIIAKLEFLCSVIFKIVKSINKDYRTDSMKKSISIFFSLFQHQTEHHSCSNACTWP